MMCRSNNGFSPSTSGMLLLMLFVLLAVMSYPSFSKKMSPPSVVYDNRRYEAFVARTAGLNQGGKSSLMAAVAVCLSFGTFLWELLRLLDIVNTMELQDGEEDWRESFYVRSSPFSSSNDK